MGPPRRSPAKPSPRPLPPPALEDEGEYDPFARRGLRRSPETGIGPRHIEPELPPSVDDPVSSTPPRGIHSSSSPSRRRATKSRKTTGMTSSPLKQPPARPGDEPSGTTQKSLFGSKASPLKQPPARPGNENDSVSPRKGGQPVQPSRLRQMTALAESTNNIRRLPAFDPNADKKKERDGLRAELTKLKKDLEVTTRQNERIRAMQRTGRMVPLEDEKEIMAIIQRYLIPGEVNPGPTQSHLLMRAALNPMAIVPFGKPAVSVLPSEEDEVDVSDIKSHHPISMTAKEELPFLQLFSPFSATSTLVVLPRVSDEPLKQIFNVQLRSRHCPGLFAAKIRATVDATSLSILSLDVIALEASAKHELGGFLEKICTGDCNRSMQRNVGIVTWAMGEWLRIAERRARLWVQLNEEFGTKDALVETSANARTRRAKRGKDDADDDREYETAPLQKSELLRYMGQQFFDVQIPSDEGPKPSSARLSWKIEFDWSGEARSNVAVMTGVPGKCEYTSSYSAPKTTTNGHPGHDADEKGALGRVPSLFEDLVEGGEQSILAMRKVVALLVGEA